MSEVKTRHRLCFRWLLCLVFVLAALGVIWFGNAFLERQHAARMVAAAIAVTDRLDPAWTWDELQARRKPVANDNNSALVVIEARRLMPHSWPRSRYFGGGTIPEAGAEPHPAALNLAWAEFWKSLDQLPGNISLNTQQMTVLTQELKAAEPALQHLGKLAKMPDGRYPSPVNESFLPAANDTFLSSLVEPLRYQAMMDLQNGRVAEALRWCRIAVNSARSNGDEPSFYSQHWRLSYMAYCCETLMRVLAQAELTAEDLSNFAKIIEGEVQRPALLIGLRGERARYFHFFSAAAAGKVPQSELDKWVNSRGQSNRPLFDLQGLKERFSSDFPYYATGDANCERARALVLQHYNPLVETAKLPLERQSWAVSNTPSWFLDNVPAVLVERVGKANYAILRSTLVALAAERFRQQHGCWPETLQQLAPDYITAVPLDPYDGKELRYRPHANGVLIYSIGRDTIDQQGDLPDNDVGVSLWDVSKRRQPTLPPIRPKKPEEL